MKLILLMILAIIIHGNCFSQEVLNDSIYELSQVQISSERIDYYSLGLKSVEIDSLDLDLNHNEDLGGLLARQSPIYIKSYGLGSLATISFRGTSAAHTGIYWNGFNINPPNIGSSDLSLIPTSFFNSVELLYGASGSLFGNGNIGGNIQLVNKPLFQKGLDAKLNLSLGSFHSYGVNASVNLSNEKWWSSTAFIYKNAENDFPFTNLYGETEIRENNTVEQIGFIQNVNRKIGNSNLLGLSLWYQKANREIPNTLVSKPSNAFQNDEAIRISGNWKYFFNKGVFELKSAFFNDELNYSDPDSQIEINQNSNILTKKIIAEANVQYNLNHNIKFSSGINFTNLSGTSTAYSQNHQRSQVGIFGLALYRLPFIEWQINLNLRQDFIESFTVPFTPSLGLEGKIWKFIYGKLNFSRNFRAPSFNDLYWEPYGNTGLQPEISQNGELGLLMINKNKSLSSEFSGTVYTSMIDNWIIWIPVNNNWSPENIQKVWSRGVEIEEKMNVKIKKSNLRVSIGYAFVKSTNQNKIDENDQSFQKQLIYVPEHSVSGNVEYLFHHFIIGLNSSYTSKRYVTRDNTEYLPAYFLSDIRIVKNFNLKKNSFDLRFEINNIWNLEYQAIQYYPMPGRNFQFSVNFKIKK